MTQYSTIYFAWYTCDVGYERRGYEQRVCDLFTGEWDRTVPICEECTLPSIPITTIQSGDIMLIHSAHYVQHLSTVDILEIFNTEQ